MGLGRWAVAGALVLLALSYAQQASSVSTSDSRSQRTLQATGGPSNATSNATAATGAHSVKEDEKHLHKEKEEKEKEHKEHGKKNEHDKKKKKKHKKKKKPTPEDFMGNVKVARIMEAVTVMADSMFAINFTATNLMHVDGTLTAAHIEAKTCEAEKIRTSVLAPKKGVLMVDGDLVILNSVKRHPKHKKPAAVSAVSFIAEDVVIGGVKQWKLVRHDDFEGEEPAKGWSLLETSSCTGRDHFLGGHCNIASGEVSKHFDRLPPHNQVRVTARYHMIDDWKGETAFLKLDEHYVWADHSRAMAPAAGIEMCGSKQFPERKMSIPIDVTLPHAASLLEVSFGSKGLSEHEDPCARSFGVDDVMVYVR